MPHFYVKKLGETLECHSDSDERLRRLEDDLKSRRPEGSDSEDEGLSADENEVLRGIFSMSGLGEVSLKIITMVSLTNYPFIVGLLIVMTFNSFLKLSFYCWFIDSHDI